MPVIPTCVPDVYHGEEQRYCTFNYTTIPADFGDDAPAHERYLVQVHLFCQHGENSIETRKRIKQRLFAAGFTWPEEINVYASYRNKNDEAGQHYTFECEYAMGVELDGAL